jgi:hypothetical protein
VGPILPYLHTVTAPSPLLSLSLKGTNETEKGGGEGRQELRL